MAVTKEELIAQNYECRNSHLISSGLEEFTYLIVHRSTPKIYYVNSKLGSTIVRLAKGKFIGIGYGQTENEAWENAQSRIKYVGYLTSAY